MLRSVGQVSAILSRATGFRPALIARKIRNWVQTGTFVPTDRSSRGTQIIESLFDDNDLLRLFVLLRLDRIGVARHLACAVQFAVPSEISEKAALVIDVSSYGTLLSVVVDPTAGLVAPEGMSLVLPIGKMATDLREATSEL